MSRWREMKEMRVPKKAESKDILVKLKSGKIHIGTCIFLSGRVHSWSYFYRGLDYAPMCGDEDEIAHWKPLPTAKKIAELI